MKIPLNARSILVTGATGYVGGRLVPRLLEAGHSVRILVRDPSRIIGRSWADNVEVFKGDVANFETLPKAMEGVDTTYYLIHSLAQGRDFIETEIKAARNFAKAAKAAGVKHIIYLGQLGQPVETRPVSPYLQARHQTGEALRGSGIPVTEFPVGVIVTNIS